MDVLNQYDALMECFFEEFKKNLLQRESTANDNVPTLYFNEENEDLEKKVTETELKYAFYEKECTLLEKLDEVSQSRNAMQQEYIKLRDDLNELQKKFYTLTNENNLLKHREETMKEQLRMKENIIQSQKDYIHTLETQNRQDRNENGERSNEPNKRNQTKRARQTKKKFKIPIRYA